MGKITIIGILLAVLIYFILRRFNFFDFVKPEQHVTNSRIVHIDIPIHLLKKGLKRVLYTVGSGVLLLFVILLIAAKFKIALILLPISLYLIGQFFVFNNHVKTLKNQKIHYNSETQNTRIEWVDGRFVEFNIMQDIKEVREVRAVQKNNGLLMGYYQLNLGSETVFLPFLLIENPDSKLFFDKLQLFNREVETKLFPII